MSKIPKKTINDLAAIRKLLGRSQRDMARLLGISTRSLQSYEQGWRTVPEHIGRMMEFFRALKQRKEKPNRKPCWVLMHCDPDKRNECLAYQLDAGDLCWLVTGNRSGGSDLPTWEKKMETCRRCPVMKQANPS